MDACGYPRVPGVERRAASDEGQVMARVGMGGHRVGRATPSSTHTRQRINAIRFRRPQRRDGSSTRKRAHDPQSRPRHPDRAAHAPADRASGMPALRRYPAVQRRAPDRGGAPPHDHRRRRPAPRFHWTGRTDVEWDSSTTIGMQCDDCRHTVRGGLLGAGQPVSAHTAVTLVPTAPVAQRLL
jgi:hypothetical protein